MIRSFLPCYEEFLSNLWKYFKLVCELNDNDTNYVSVFTDIVKKLAKAKKLTKLFLIQK